MILCAAWTRPQKIAKQKRTVIKTAADRRWKGNSSSGAPHPLALNITARRRKQTIFQSSCSSADNCNGNISDELTVNGAKKRDNGFLGFNYVNWGLQHLIKLVGVPSECLSVLTNLHFSGYGFQSLIILYQWGYHFKRAFMSVIQTVRIIAYFKNLGFLHHQCEKFVFCLHRLWIN